MIPTTRKRKLPSLDSDSHPAKKGARRELSPVKSVKSPRKKPPGRVDKQNCPSPLKPSIVTNSFYGKQKTVYLTPLERKAIKDSLPSPPSVPRPPSEAKEPDENKKKSVKRGNKMKKVSAGSNNKGNRSIKNLSSVKTIKLSKLNSVATSESSTAVSSANVTKPADPKKVITITFSNLKPKPKIFVGAAFFGTGKKPSSMYKKSTPKSSTRPASAQEKSKTAPSQVKSEKSKLLQQPQRPESAMNQPQTQPGKTAGQVTDTDKKHLSTKKQVTFDPTDWMDSVNEKHESLTPSSSPKVVKENHVIMKELSVVLIRTPPKATSISAQDDSLTDSPEPVFDPSDVSPTSAASSPPNEPAAVYPIFGSASKRLRNSPRLNPPVSSASGPVASLQSSAVKERALRRRKEKQDNDQLIIDAGQKQFGAATCSSCGMVYSTDNPEDNFQHTQFHQRFLESIRFVGWKKERMVAEFWDGKILLVMPDDPKYAIRKADEVRRVADNELGFQQVTLSSPSKAQTYLFINTERMVVGCLIAEPIRQAYRVLAQPDQHKDMTKDDFMERHRAWCCSTVPEEALCGISRIWVFSQARRHGIATRMLDTVRSTFTYGSHLTKEEIAFSDPTPDGKLFATKYCNTPTFLVYNFVA
ncbi:N-acetyltransferase ESCO2 isoform X2 [Betta splendens]|uniref:N-acetyltransferase ESCO2 isoform X2 n=1 Tax=Betta splendens TaxID=158456 RepID=A0A6P7LRF1_BETSP|nr:N-acetyltransferase ESCO2 isoform X2 [Betta splendens]